MPDQAEGQAEDLISGLMKRVTGDGGAKGGSSFPVTLILVGILVVVISIMGFQLAFAKRRAAELTVKIRRAEEEKKRAEENVKLGENSTARQVAQEEVQARGKEVLGLKAKLARRHQEHKRALGKLKGITSWDDIVIIDGRSGE